jgi:hypothetical protein
VLTENRYSVRFALMCRSPFVAGARAGQQHKRLDGAISELGAARKTAGAYWRILFLVRGG